MKKIQYRFDPQTLTYQVITIPLKMRFYRVLRKALIGFIVASLANFVFSYFFYTPKMYRLSHQRENLLLRHHILQDKINEMAGELGEIKSRDNNVYRPVLGVDSLAMEVIYMPYPDQKYASLPRQYDGLLVESWKSLDQLARSVYLESVSLDQIEGLAANKELMAEAIPAFWPIDRQQIRNIGKFGWRIDPVYGGSRFHAGIDFAGKIGTPIYATGNGKVEKAEISRGYGKEIVINHGYGYKTRYAHLSYMSVLPGQQIKRGEQIGELGNSGKSTGPHLHYEVLYRGAPVSPLGYLSRNISKEDFKAIIEKATDTTYE